MPAVVLPVMIGLLLSSCASDGAQETVVDIPAESRLFDSPAEGYSYAIGQNFALMAQVLEDGQVSREEYEIAFAANLACRERNGWVFGSNPVWNPVDRLRLIVDEKAPQAALTPEYREAEETCSNQFEYISYLFQTTARPETEPPLLAYIASCLRDNGVQHEAGEGSVKAMIGPEAPNSPEFELILACVADGISTLHPGLVGYSVAL